MTAASPLLSVIMTADGRPASRPVSLVAAAAKRVEPGVEIILAYSSDEAPSEEIDRDYSGFIVIRLPGATTLPGLLGAALARERGEVIAITDTTCEVAEDWVSEILKAHAAPHPVIGGSVEPDGLRCMVNWAAYFCDYGQFMRPLVEGTVNELPGNNISVKRWVLERGKEFVAPEFWKTYWCRRIQAEGIRLHSTPSIVVHYRKSFRLVPYLLHRFHSGRCFAGMRLRELSRLRRACYVAAAPALLILLTARMLWKTLGKRRRLTELALSFPISLLAILAWVLGELCGYLAGSGVSCNHVR
jgi:hypothetical protein